MTKFEINGCYLKNLLTLSVLNIFEVTNES